MERGAPGRSVLLVGHNAGGTVPPMLAVAQAMVARGHVVTWLSQPSVRERAVAAGCRFTPFDGLEDYDPGTPIEEQLELALAGIAGTGIGEQVLAVAADTQAGAVVVDCNLTSAAAAAESLEAPSAVLFHSMFRTFSDVWFGELWPLLEPAVNDARRSFGVDPAGSWNGVFAQHDRLISVVPESFDATVADAPETLRHYGFLVPEPRSANATAGFPEGDGPAVLVSLSTTYQHQEDRLATVIDALADRPVRGLVTTSGHAGVALAAPANVTVRDYVDHGLILGETDALITHGGLGTVAAGLSHAVPLVCVPLGRDQYLNAQRVADLGAGIALAEDVSSTQIGNALDELLADASYRASAGALASASVQAGGAASVVDDLERLLT